MSLKFRSPNTGVKDTLALQRIRLLKVLCGMVFLAWLGSPAPVAAMAILNSYRVQVSWIPSPAPEIAGYHVQYGTSPGNYSNSILVGDVASTTISGLSAGVTYYFVVSAYDADGMESERSSEVSFVPGTPFTQLEIQPGGPANISVKGMIGHVYEIQATQDFITWNVVGMVTLGASGSANFIDPTPMIHSACFYRTRDIQL